MPKYYCDYCQIYLTHDTSKVRRDHNSGWKHALQVKNYYTNQISQQELQWTLEDICKEYTSRGIPIPPPPGVSVSLAAAGGNSGGPPMRLPMGPLAHAPGQFASLPFPVPPFAAAAVPGAFAFPPGAMPPPPFVFRPPRAAHAGLAAPGGQNQHPHPMHFPFPPPPPPFPQVPQNVLPPALPQPPPAVPPQPPAYAASVPGSTPSQAVENTSKTQ